MRIYYCDNCDRLIRVYEQTQEMFVDQKETAYCRECRESFCQSNHDLEGLDPSDSQSNFPAKRRPKSGFWRACTGVMPPISA